MHIRGDLPEKPVLASTGDCDLLSKAPHIFITISIDQEAEKTILCKTGSKDKSLDLPQGTAFKGGGIYPGAESSDTFPWFLGT